MVKKISRLALFKLCQHFDALFFDHRDENILEGRQHHFHADNRDLVFFEQLGNPALDFLIFDQHMHQHTMHGSIDHAGEFICQGHCLVGMVALNFE